MTTSEYLVGSGYTRDPEDASGDRDSIKTLVGDLINALSPCQTHARAAIVGP